MNVFIYEIKNIYLDFKITKYVQGYNYNIRKKSLQINYFGVRHQKH